MKSRSFGSLVVAAQLPAPAFARERRRRLFLSHAARECAETAACANMKKAGEQLYPSGASKREYDVNSDRGWCHIRATEGMSHAGVQRLYALTTSAPQKESDVRARITEFEFELIAFTPVKCKSMLQVKRARWAPVSRTNKIKME